MEDINNKNNRRSQIVGGQDKVDYNMQYSLTGTRKPTFIKENRSKSFKSKALKEPKYKSKFMQETIDREKQERDNIIQEQ